MNAEDAAATNSNWPLQPPDGAFQMGGGDNHYGQDYTDDIVKSLWEVPEFGFLNSLSVLRDVLRKLPLDKLTRFKSFLPDATDDDFLDVGTAVDKIVDALSPDAIVARVKDLRDMITELLDGIGLPGVGDFIDRIQDLRNGISDWLLGTEEDHAAIENLGDRVTDVIRRAWEGVLGGDGTGKTIDDLKSALQNIPQGNIAGLAEVLSSLTDKLQGIIDKILSALRKIPIIGGQLDDLGSDLTTFVETTQTSAVNQQNFQIATVTGGYRNPAWVCRYPIADVTFPEFVFGGFPIQGTTGAQSTGTAHTHSAGSLSTGLTTQGIAPGESLGGIVTVSNSTIMDTVAINVDKNDDAPINNVYIEVFREAADGSMSRISSVEVSASISYFTGYVEAELPSGVIAQAGERYLIKVRNSSTVANNVNLVFFRQGSGSVDLSFYTTVASGLTSETSYTSSEVATALAATNSMPWVMLAAKNVTQTDQSFSDDFNRSAFGGLWVQFSDTGSNQLRIDNSKATFNGGTNGYQGVLYARRVASDGNRVEGDLSLTNQANARLGLLLHCDREFTQQVYLAVNADDAKIYSGPPGSMTERASHATGGEGKWVLYYDETNDKYVAEKDGAPTGLEWTGVSTAVSHGENFRFGGLRIERSTVVLVPITAGQIDNWTLRDWQPA